MHQYSVIFTDIHGTLLPSHKQNEEKFYTDKQVEEIKLYCKKLNELRAINNIKLVIITGGQIPDILQLEHSFGLQYDACYIEQGGLYSLDSGKTWRLNSLIDLEHKEKINLEFTNFKTYLQSLVGSSYSLNRLSSGLIQIFEVKRQGVWVPQKLLSDYTQLYSKIKNYFLNTDYKLYLIGFSCRPPNFHCMTYMLSPKNIDKYNAMLHYAKTYDINLSNCLFYGNGTNDLEALVEGPHAKLISTSPQFFEYIDPEPSRKLTKIQYAKSKLTKGLYEWLTNE